jgi:cyclin-dependent kinase 12/13
LLALRNWSIFIYFKNIVLSFTIFVSFATVCVQIGSGTYSNVYKAIEVESGRVVALKKVRVDGVGEAESARFMAREIALLRRLGDHPNVVRLNGLVTSRLNTAPSLYLVFDYMEHDLTGLTACATASGRRLSLPQVWSLSPLLCM